MIGNAANTGQPTIKAILCADVVGYTAAIKENERLCLEQVKLFATAFDGCVTREGGRVFAQAGDSFYAVFDTPRAGVRAARAFADQVEALIAERQITMDLNIRQGLFFGEATRQDDGNYLGNAPNMASRLQEEARPGGILTSSSVVDLVGDGPDARFQRRQKITVRKTNAVLEVFDVLPPGPQSWVQRTERGWWLVKKRYASPQSLSVIVFFAALSTIAFVALVRNEETARTDRMNVAFSILSERIENLTSIVESSAPPATEIGRQKIIREAMTSLINSRSPVKAQAVELITQNKKAEAVVLLERYLASLHPDYVDERLVTLREIGALVLALDPVKAREIFMEINELSPGEPAVLDQLGRLSALQEDFPEALAYYRALEASDPDDAILQISAELGMGRAHLALKNPEAGIAFLNAAKNKLERLIRDAGTAVPRPFLLLSAEIENKIGAYHTLVNNEPMAIRHRRRALLIAQNNGDVVAQHEALRSLAGIFLLAEDYEDAYAAFSEMDLIMRTVENREDVMWFNYNWALAAKGIGNGPDVLKLLDRALTIAHDINDERGIVLILKSFSNEYKRIDDRENLCRTLSQALKTDPETQKRFTIDFQGDFDEARCKHSSPAEDVAALNCRSGASKCP